jgi:hypothetical protein
MVNVMKWALENKMVNDVTKLMSYCMQFKCHVKFMKFIDLVKNTKDNELYSNFKYHAIDNIEDSSTDEFNRYVDDIEIRYIMPQYFQMIKAPNNYNMITEFLDQIEI